MKCNHCGRKIRFIKREGKKPLVVDCNPEYFVPDNHGVDNFIHNGIFRRGSRSNDGLQGYRLHNCEN